MRRMKISMRCWWVPGLLLTCVLARSAAAIYLDDAQSVSLRARIYTQAAIRTEGSFGDTTPTVQAGQLVQHRNFFNPELEAKLASYATWMKDWGPLSYIAPDGLDFRIAGWGFYDGIYDYGTQQFDQARKQLRARFSEATDLSDVLTGRDDVKNAREIYAHQRRLNELYLSYSKGPLFVRVGKQAISWGESDTIAILDQNNPFDITVAAPGIFEDIDEARIPLWTIRTSYSLFEALGPLSSGFVEAYWVPGDLDTTTAIVPMLTVSPYSAPGKDPQDQLAPLAKALPSSPLAKAKVVVADHVPAPKMDSSRYGVRVQAVAARDHTVSAWFYTTYPNAPVPRLVGLATPKGGGDPLLITETVHELVPVFGLSDTFFFETLNGIVRAEAEYFNREPAFLPDKNLLVPQLANFNKFLKGCKNAKGTPIVCPAGAVPDGAPLPRASFLRWELGFDRFFFLRPVNPTNSFTWVTALVGSYNMDETSKKDYRFATQRPGTSGTSVDDYVELPKVDMFFQTHATTDYMHGRLTPGVTVIVNVVGAWVAQTQLTYRYSDALLLDLYYLALGGAFNAGTGQFRDRDQVALRATYQLN
jgi:hypothetical protein